MKQKLFLMVALLAALLNCSKDAVVGPEGAPGAPGTVNVQTFVFDLDYSKITVTGWYAYFQIEIPGLTSEIEESGLVQVYRNRNGWQSLPFQTPIFTDGDKVTESCITTFHFRDGKLTLDFYPSFYCESASYFPDGQFKVVLVNARMGGDNV